MRDLVLSLYLLGRIRCVTSILPTDIQNTNMFIDTKHDITRVTHRQCPISTVYEALILNNLCSDNRDAMVYFGVMT